MIYGSAQKTHRVLLVVYFIKLLDEWNLVVMVQVVVAMPKLVADVVSTLLGRYLWEARELRLLVQSQRVIGCIVLPVRLEITKELIVGIVLFPAPLGQFTCCLLLARRGRSAVFSMGVYFSDLPAIGCA